MQFPDFDCIYINGSLIPNKYLHIECKSMTTFRFIIQNVQANFSLKVVLGRTIWAYGSSRVSTSLVNTCSGALIHHNGGFDSKSQCFLSCGFGRPRLNRLISCFILFIIHSIWRGGGGGGPHLMHIIKPLQGDRRSTTLLVSGVVHL